MGLLRISESIKAYEYLILSLQASARSSIIGNMASALTTQKSFLNNFENVMNHRIDIREDIKRYQETLRYVSSKVDYNMGESTCMLPSDMNLTIKSGFVGHNHKILVSDGTFSLEKNDKVNTLELAEEPKINHKVVVQPTITHKNVATRRGKVALVLSLAVAFRIHGTVSNKKD